MATTVETKTKINSNSLAYENATVKAAIEAVNKLKIKTAEELKANKDAAIAAILAFLNANNEVNGSFFHPSMSFYSLAPEDSFVKLRVSGISAKVINVDVSLFKINADNEIVSEEYMKTVKLPVVPEQFASAVVEKLACFIIYDAIGKKSPFIGNKTNALKSLSALRDYKGHWTGWE